MRMRGGELVAPSDSLSRRAAGMMDRVALSRARKCGANKQIDLTRIV